MKKLIIIILIFVTLSEVEVFAQWHSIYKGSEIDTAVTAARAIYQGTAPANTAPDGLDVITGINNETGALQSMALNSLPATIATNIALAQKTNSTAFEDTVRYFINEIVRLDARIDNVAGGVDTTTTPTSVIDLAITHTASSTAGAFTLTWDEVGTLDTIIIYQAKKLSTGSSFSAYDSIATVDNGVKTWTQGGYVPHDSTYRFYVRAGNEGVKSNVDTALMRYVEDFITTNYYVSNAVAGAGTGLSWATAKRFHEFDESVLLSGDSVLVDGGVDGLIYDYTSMGVSSNIANYITDVTGTANNHIVFTRGKDASHNGVPVIRGKTRYAIYLERCNYLEFSYLKFDSTGTGANARTCIVLQENSSNIDILHNYFDYKGGYAIQFNNNDNIRILYNDFYTAGDQDKESDIMQGINAGYIENLELAYNTMINLNADVTNNPHRDVLQLTYVGGTTRIHNNFIYVDIPVLAQGIYLEEVIGNLYIYDNIISMRGGYDGTDKGGSINIQSQGGAANFYVFNNTIIDSGASLITMMDANNLYFKNNLVDWTNGFTPYVTQTNTDYSKFFFDYNVYKNGDATEAPRGTWTQWTGATYNSQDANSTNSGFTLVGAHSTTATDYALDTGSAGIDEGTDLSAIFTIDYLGATWTGTWDAGAIMYVP